MNNSPTWVPQAENETWKKKSYYQEYKYMNILLLLCSTHKRISRWVRTKHFKGRKEQAQEMSNLQLPAHVTAPSVHSSMFWSWDTLPHIDKAVHTSRVQLRAQGSKMAALTRRDMRSKANRLHMKQRG